MRRSTTARGYGATHQQIRRSWMPYVASGRVSCARCGEQIKPGEPWHLDHADDRRGYLGPSHARCNERAAAEKSKRARLDPKPRTVTRW